jgi:hypothetical protein
MLPRTLFIAQFYSYSVENLVLKKLHVLLRNWCIFFHLIIRAVKFRQTSLKAGRLGTRLSV